MNVDGDQWTPWRKSSRSDAGGNCVEVAFSTGRVGVRHSKLGPDSPILLFTAGQWLAFLDGQPSAVAVGTVGAGGVEMRTGGRGENGPVLVFSFGEWEAFRAGIADGEFRPPMPGASASNFDPKE